jgi:hypothetical protein
MSSLSSVKRLSRATGVCRSKTDNDSQRLTPPFRLTAKRTNGGPVVGCRTAISLKGGENAGKRMSCRLVMVVGMWLTHEASLPDEFCFRLRTPLAVSTLNASRLNRVLM